MKKDYSLLLIGSLNSIYIVDFIKHLKKVNPESHIYFLGGSGDSECFDCLDNYCFFDNIRFISRIPLIRSIAARLVMWKSVKKMCKSNKFDFACIHFIDSRYAYVMDLLRTCTSKVVLCPWGSDVYRVNERQRKLQMKIYTKADYVTGSESRFTNDVVSYYNVPKNKLVPLTLGASSIDYILAHKDTITTEMAKKKYGLEDKYVITCGYNASKAQNHFAIIDAICNVKEKLPENIVLLFPFTYGRNLTYITEVKKKLKTTNLNACFVEDFLDMEKLFLLRQATDMFIHIQTSDAKSASVREYLLCNKKVINGEWLRYPELETVTEAPYFIVDKLEHLGDVIDEAYNSKPKKLSSEAFCLIEKCSWKKAIIDWNEFFMRSC